MFVPIAMPVLRPALARTATWKGPTGTAASRPSPGMMLIGGMVKVISGSNSLWVISPPTSSTR